LALASKESFPCTRPSSITSTWFKKGHVRRAKLYYLRQLRGKAARIRERDTRQSADTAGAAAVGRLKPRNEVAQVDNLRRVPVHSQAHNLLYSSSHREPSLHIAIDAHSVGAKLGGNETYATNLIEALAEIDQLNRYTLYVTKREAIERFANRWPNFTVKQTLPHTHWCVFP
jgi:hypothetical protein